MFFRHLHLGPSYDTCHCFTLFCIINFSLFTSSFPSSSQPSLYLSTYKTLPNATSTFRYHPISLVIFKADSSENFPHLTSPFFSSSFSLLRMFRRCLHSHHSTKEAPIKDSVDLFFGKPNDQFLVHLATIASSF